MWLAQEPNTNSLKLLSKAKRHSILDYLADEAYCGGSTLSKIGRQMFERAWSHGVTIEGTPPVDRKSLAVVWISCIVARVPDLELARPHSLIAVSANKRREAIS
jgi:hypothetical protein